MIVADITVVREVTVLSFEKFWPVVTVVISSSDTSDSSDCCCDFNDNYECSVLIGSKCNSNSIILSDSYDSFDSSYIS